MRENDSNLFSKWENELPPPEDLVPLSQSLITPDLALAFNISNPLASPNLSPELDSTEPGGGGSDDTAQTLKRPRLMCTPHIHNRFVDAVAHLRIKNPVPKTIMQIMNVEGLTRENVASHLQKYNLYLKQMQSISSDDVREAFDIDSATPTSKLMRETNEGYECSITTSIGSNSTTETNDVSSSLADRVMEPSSSSSSPRLPPS